MKKKNIIIISVLKRVTLNNWCYINTRRGNCSKINCRLNSRSFCLYRLFCKKGFDRRFGRNSCMVFIRMTIGMHKIYSFVLRYSQGKTQSGTAKDQVNQSHKANNQLLSHSCKITNQFINQVAGNVKNYQFL